MASSRVAAKLCRPLRAGRSGKVYIRLGQTAWCTSINRTSSLTAPHCIYWSHLPKLRPRLYYSASPSLQMDTSVMMKAAVIYEAGGPEVLKLETIPVPQPKDDEVLIRIKAFGLNRSELFTRQWHSPGVKFPRVLGIEACGLVGNAPGGQFEKKNQIVATALGGMVRQPPAVSNPLSDMRALTQFRCRDGYLMVVTPSSLASLRLMFRLWRQSWRGRSWAPYPKCSRQRMDRSLRL